MVAAREVLFQEGSCAGMHGRMVLHGAPAVDQGVGGGASRRAAAW